MQSSDFSPISTITAEAFGVDACSEDDLRQWAKHEASVFRIAAIAECPIGYSACFKFKPSYAIGLIAVAADQRRKGIGMMLMKDSLHTARQLGYAVVSLYVNDSNESAIRMYKKLDFKQIGVSEKYYQDGADALIMERCL
jgi:[ribosomal protein S18]-alanine N-acetyltransferase